MQVKVGGKHAQVLHLEQRHVYADVIEGVPNADINQGIVDEAVARAARLGAGEPHLVPPRERSLGSFGDEEKRSLPPIACIARVRGAPIDAAADHAEASLVWFQDEVSTTLPEDVAAALDAKRWSDIAQDVFW